MFAFDPNTTPKAWNAYNKHYNPDGTVSEIRFLMNGELQFTWKYSYSDGKETGCEIVIP